MTFDCDSWMELSDRVALGEVVSDRELAFLRAHEATCRWCAREVAVFREAGPSTLHAVPDADEVERILRCAAVDPLGVEARRARGPLKHARAFVNGAQTRLRARVGVLSGGAAALVAAAAALVLLFRGTQVAPTADAPAPSRTALTSSASVAVKSPAPAENALIAKSNEDTCGTLVAGIVLCLARGSEVGAVELATPQRVVHLKRGRAVAMLEPQPAGASFSISSDAGKVTAIGTVFSVEVLPNGGAVARVSRGKVLVGSSGKAPEQVLLAGQRVQLGEVGGSRLPEEERRRDLALIETLHTDRGESSAEEQAALDSETAALDSELSHQKPRDTNDALARARALRARGEFARAAQVYRDIHAGDPKGSSGRAALVSLGSLLLSSLNDAPGALAAYNRYLSGGRGPLRQQAEYGRIRALRALGRSSEEQAAVKAFVDRYPSAPETRLLKQASDTGH